MRFFSESFFESFKISIGKSFGKITALAQTGPAKGPRPASSNSTIELLDNEIFK